MDTKVKIENFIETKQIYSGDPITLSAGFTEIL